MSLIDRYIFAVTEQLPERMKEDVARELRGNIEDMLPENFTEDDVKATLQELGNPWKIAEEYQPRPRYIIGPALYNKYITVLKLVVGIVISVFAAITIIGWVFTPDFNHPSYTDIVVDLFVELLGAIIEGGVHAALWVTLIFVAIERNWFLKDDQHEVIFGSPAKENWSIDDLPQTQLQARKIPRSSSIISIIVTLLFTAVLYIRPDLISIFIKVSEGKLTNYPLLDTERLQIYLPIILLLAIAEIILFVWKYIVQYWDIKLWAAHLALSVALGILLIIMANDTVLIREEFLAEAARIFEVSSLQKLWNNIVRIFVAAVVVITLWDGIDTFLKTRKK